MGIYDYLPAGVKNFFNAQQKEEKFVKKESKGLSFTFSGNRTFRFEAEIRDLDVAIAAALDEELPNRIPLYTIYENLTDLHVKSQIRTAIFKAASQPWILVDNNGKRKKDLEKLLQKSWFETFAETFVHTEFYGHSLVYFWLGDDGEFKETKIIPRMNVSPEKGALIPNLNFPDKTVSYRNNALFKTMLLEIGKSDDLGILKDITRHSILKGYALKDWARSSEKWGDPLLVFQTASDDEEENDEKEAAAANFGNNGYLMPDVDDKVTLLERKSSGSSHKIFMDLIKINNDENSKGVNGQVATADQKSFVGAAEVQERLLNDYTKARLRSLMYYVNESLIPFLIQYNFGQTVYKALDGVKWVPSALLQEEDSGKPKNPKKDDPEPLDPKNNNNPFA